METVTLVNRTPVLSAAIDAMAPEEGRSRCTIALAWSGAAPAGRTVIMPCFSPRVTSHQFIG